MKKSTHTAATTEAKKTGDNEQTIARARYDHKSDKEGEKNFSETMNFMAKQRAGPSGQHLAEFATLPSAEVKVARAKRNRQKAFVVTIEKLLTRGKKKQGLDCLV